MRRLGVFVCVVTLLGAAAADEDERPKTEIVKVATDYRFTEGPALDAKGRIVFTDIPNERIHRFDPKSGKASVLREASGRANGLLYDADGRLLACEGGRRRLVRIDGDQVEMLADRFEGKRLNSPNDLTLDAKGGIYFTDPRYGKQDDRELDFEGVYYRAPDGTLSRVCAEAEKPNGIHLARNGRTLYVADSKRKLILAYDVATPGTATDGRLFARLDEKARGGPDGMTIDDQDRVYCAGQGKIWIWDGTGKPIESVRMPESPTNCLFVKADGMAVSLYVTARTSLYRVTRRSR